MVNGQINYNGAQITEGRYTVDTMASFICNCGYHVNGPNSRSYDQLQDTQAQFSQGVYTAYWTQQTPSCELGNEDML